MATHQLNGRTHLTDLEAVVISAIAEGVSDLEAAARLYLSEQAVRRHVRSAMRKWAASDRKVILLLWADANGSISGDLHR